MAANKKFKYVFTTYPVGFNKQINRAGAVQMTFVLLGPVGGLPALLLNNSIELGQIPNNTFKEDINQNEEGTDNYQIYCVNNACLVISKYETT